MDFKTFFQLKAWLAENRSSFTPEELKKVCNFILAHNTCQQITRSPTVVVQQPRCMANESVVPVHEPEAKNVNAVSNTKLVGHVQVQCRHCGVSEGLTTQSGRYGYFVKCAACGGNTPLKRPCLVCNSADTKVSKSKTVYSLACQSCGAFAEIFSADFD